MDYLLWINQRIAEAGVTQAELGHVLGMSRSNVSRLLRGVIPARIEDLDRIAAYLGLTPTLVNSDEAPAGKVYTVRVVGIVRRGAWFEAEKLPGSFGLTNGVHDSRYPIEQQSAVRLDEPSFDGRFVPGDFLVFVPVERFRPMLLPNDLVIRLVRNQGLSAYQVVHVSNDGGLVDIITGSRIMDGDAEPVGLAIAMYRPLA